MNTHASHPEHAIPVDVRRRAPEAVRYLEGLLQSDLETDLQRARMLANWLDAKFNIGGVRFGFDSLIGLIPGVGDTVASLIGLYPLWIASRHKLGKWVQARMLGNLVADWGVGLVPLVGDVLDVGYKGNLRNLALLEKAAAKRMAKAGKPPVKGL